MIYYILLYYFNICNLFATLSHIISEIGTFTQDVREKIKMSKFQTLTEEAQNGDISAFKEIFELLTDRLFNYALLHTKSREDALDIVQETFIDLWRALPDFSYKGDESFYGFVFVILKRKLIKLYEKNNKLNEVSLDESNIEESYTLETEDYRNLHKYIKKLPDNYKDVLLLRYWSDLPFKSIAEILNINEQTVKVWHHRAVKELQNLIGNIEYEF